MEEFKMLRRKINNIDEELLLLLSKRFSVVKKIGNYKKNNGLPVIDKIREKNIIETLSLKAAAYKISKRCVKSIWDAMFKEAYSKE